jgi:hypothetical protein
LEAVDDLSAETKPGKEQKETAQSKGAFRALPLTAIHLEETLRAG